MTPFASSRAITRVAVGAALLVGAATTVVAVPGSGATPPDKIPVAWPQQTGTDSGEDTYGVATSPSGDVYIVGETTGTLPGQAYEGGYDGFLIKHDRNGNQKWVRQFGTSAGDTPRGVAVARSGDIYVVGDTGGTLPGQTSGGNDDLFLIKYDRNGNQKWIRQFGVDTYERGYAVAVSRSGDIYVVGDTSGTLPGQPSAGGSDAFVAKYDRNGNQKWVRQYGTDQYDGARSVAVSGAGDIYVIGDTQGSFPDHSLSGDQDGFILKYDKYGNQKWVRQYGGTGYVNSRGATVSRAGDVYVTGDTTGVLTGQTGVGIDDAFVVKYDKNGNLLWARQFGTDQNDYSYSAAVIGTTLYVTGETRGAFAGFDNLGDTDGFIAALATSDGGPRWTRQFGTTGSDYEQRLAVRANNNNGGALVVAGYTCGGTVWGQARAGTGDDCDAYIATFPTTAPPAGQVAPGWPQQTGGTSNTYPYGIVTSAGGDVYLAGETGGELPGQTSLGGYDGFLIKYDRNGNQKWIRQYGTSAGDTPDAVAISRSGDVYVVGETGGELPGQTSLGGYDGFLIKYDRNGNQKWARQFGGSGADRAWAVAVSGSGDIYVTGSSNAGLSGDVLGEGTQFLVKYDRNGNRKWARLFDAGADGRTRSVATSATGDVYLVGNTNGTLPGQTSVGSEDGFVIKYDRNGNQKWARQYGTTASDSVYGVTVSRTGDVYVSGNTYGTFPDETSAGDADVFLVKYDRNGNQKWAHQYGTSAQDWAYGSASVSGASVYLAMDTDGAFPGFTRIGGTDSVVAKFSTVDGSLRWARQFGTAGDDYENRLAVRSSNSFGGALVIGGYTCNGTVWGQALTAGGRCDAFVAAFPK